MHRHCQLILIFLSIAVATAGAAWSAELAFVAGTIVRPEGVNEGDSLSDGTVVETGADGMAMVEFRWPSDEPGYDCIRIVIFGYGQSYTVSGEETPGRCDTTVPANPDNLREGEAFLSKGTRYGDAKTDLLEVPKKVKNSQEQWGDFQQWTMKAERAFTGDVVSVGENRIKLRSPFSHRPVYFSAAPSTVHSPVPLDSLVDKRVQVYYKITAQGKKAVRIRLTQPIAVLPRPPFVIHNKPNAGIIQPPSGVTEIGDHGKGHNVVLTGVGNKKIELIRAFRAVTGLGLKASKEAIENTPYIVKKGLSIEEARRIEATLEKAGGRVTIEKQQ
jgi:ribosomal protein L7/L12